MTSGKHRINHGGHRQLNAAIYRTVIVRMRFHQPTIDYVARRTAEGKSKRDIIRFVSNAIVIREVCSPHQDQPQNRRNRKLTTIGASTPWPNRSTACTRPRSSNAGPGAPSTRSNSRPPNGSTGTTTDGSTNTPAATSPRSRQSTRTTLTPKPQQQAEQSNQRVLRTHRGGSPAFLPCSFGLYPEAAGRGVSDSRRSNKGRCSPILMRRAAWSSATAAGSARTRARSACARPRDPRGSLSGRPGDVPANGPLPAVAGGGGSHEVVGVNPLAQRVVAPMGEHWCAVQCVGSWSRAKPNRWAMITRSGPTQNRPWPAPLMAPLHQVQSLPGTVTSLAL